MRMPRTSADSQSRRAAGVRRGGIFGPFQSQRRRRVAVDEVGAIGHGGSAPDILGNSGGRSLDATRETKAPPGLLRAALRSDADQPRPPQNEAEERAHAAGNAPACSEKQETRAQHETET